MLMIIWVFFIFSLIIINFQIQTSTHVSILGCPRRLRVRPDLWKSNFRVELQPFGSQVKTYCVGWSEMCSPRITKSLKSLTTFNALVLTCLQQKNYSIHPSEILNFFSVDGNKNKSINYLFHCCTIYHGWCVRCCTISNLRHAYVACWSVEVSFLMVQLNVRSGRRFTRDDIITAHNPVQVFDFLICLDTFANRKENEEGLKHSLVYGIPSAQWCKSTEWRRRLLQTEYQLMIMFQGYLSFCCVYLFWPK